MSGMMEGRPGKAERSKVGEFLIRDRFGKESIQIGSEGKE